MRIVLIGAVESTKVALEVLIEKSLKPLVITLPLAYSYRHSDFVNLRDICRDNDIDLVETVNVNSYETVNTIKDYNPEYLFVIGWSQIIKKDLLNIPKKGSIGYHPSLLPKNRGRGVIPWTIIQEEKETGSTLFWLDEGVDSGDILLQRSFPLEPNETATTLYKKHINVLRDLLREAIEILQGENPPRMYQDHSKATYCAKRIPEDGLIDWNQPAKKIWTLIRAVAEPYPGAFTFYKDKKLTIWEADYIKEAPFWGLPGQIVQFSDLSALVSCGDREFILIKTVQIENGEKITPIKILKLHDKFGIDWLKLYGEYLEGKHEE